MNGDWKAFGMEYTPPKDAETTTANSTDADTVSFVIIGSQAESRTKDKS